MLIVEVKQIMAQGKLIDIMEQQDGKYLKQHMEQLRSYCIHNKKLFMIGVITNFKDWYFTKYNMTEEINSQDQYQQENPNLPQVPVFEISEPHTIIKIDFPRNTVQFD